jgi:hypothetical protein
MPYRLETVTSPAGRKSYYVVTKGTGRKHSRRPLPRSRALAQMRALYAVENGYILRRPYVSKARSHRSRNRRPTKK